MTRIRRRTGASRRELDTDERFYLMSGHRLPGTFEDPETVDVDAGAVLEAWDRHRAEMIAEREAEGLGLRPWASLFLDGEAGHSSPYCHLGAACHPRLRTPHFPDHDPKSWVPQSIVTART